MSSRLLVADEPGVFLTSPQMCRTVFVRLHTAHGTASCTAQPSSACCAVYVQDPALKRIAAVGATVFGLACAGLVGLVVSSVDRNMHINAAFSGMYSFY